MLQIIYQENQNMPYHVLTDSNHNTEESLYECGNAFKKSNSNYIVSLVNTDDWNIINEF